MTDGNGAPARPDSAGRGPNRTASHVAASQERGTRPPAAWWDRIKILVLLLVVWLVLYWGTVAGNPLISLHDGLAAAIDSYWWVLALAGLEVIRQVHYLVSEHSAGYHGFWVRLFARIEYRTGRMNDWNRYRLARTAKWVFWLIILDLVLARLLHLPPATALFQIPALVYKAAPTLLYFVMFMFIAVGQFAAIFWFLSRGGTDVYFPDDIKTRFSDVWGQDNVLDKVKENMIFLEDPESIEELGGYVPGGILLWGPPGTGKTLMAEAVAGETGHPFVFVDPGAFINMFFGVGILKVKSLFRKLRKLAVRYGGVIVFFDEADSLGNRGAMAGGNWGGGPRMGSLWSANPPCNGLSYLSQETAAALFRASLTTALPGGTKRDRAGVMGMGMSGGGGMGTLQALLTELSGLKKPRGFFNRRVRRALGMRPKPPPKYRILVMMASNMPQALDEALLRPGRIDRIYKVGYPSKAGRVRTYEGYFSKISHRLSTEEMEKLATITPYATGATIKDLVNEALINAIRDGRSAVQWRDVVKAKQLKDLGPPEDVEYIERERHAVAVHEACHAVVAYRVRRHLSIDIATIEKGGTYLGMVASIPPEDQFTRWRSEYEADIMTSLASLAGERMFFGEDSSSGVSGDLEGATQVATMMEGYWGMGSTVASHGVTNQVGIGGGGRPGKNEKGEDLLKGSLGERIETNLDRLLERTGKLLEQNRTEVLAVAHALETHKTVTGDDIEAVIEGRPGPLIDGRPYRTDQFRREAEAYHVAAAAAHKDHSTAQLRLPALPASPADGHPLGDGNGSGPIAPEEPGEAALED